MSFLYVALGDSMSIDLYPQLDLQGRGGPGALGDAGTSAVGAASLFHRNHDALWPEFEGRDLSSLLREVEKLDVCVDGATLAHTRELQLPRVPDDARAAARVVTLTAGGNDLIAGVVDPLTEVEEATTRAVRGYRELVDRHLEGFPDATVILATVYDPTDGSGMLPGLSDAGGPLPLELLETFNEAVRDAAASHDRLALADVHAHFLGHGLSAPAGERWYWPPSPIEPGARGASEIRRLWLDALG